MPMPQREMLGSGTLGFPFIPGTFPTVGVAARMKVNGVDLGWGMVDALYDAYYLALKDEGLAPYAPGSGKVSAPLLASMSKRTSQPKGVVAAWLNALYQEVQQNGRSYFLDPVTADTAAAGQVDPVNHPLSTLETLTKSAGNAAANLVKPSADALTNVIKYTALGLAAAALIYGVYQGHQFLKTRKRRKKG